jgi:hypothetical protein
MTTRNRPTLSAYAGSDAFALDGERVTAGIPAGEGEGVWLAVATRRTRLAAQLT